MYKTRRIGLLIVVLPPLLFASLGAASCNEKPKTPSREAIVQQSKSDSGGTPILFVRTKDNQGRRCQAKYYFGIGNVGGDKGYSRFCHDLQLRLLKAAEDGQVEELTDTLRYGANVNLPVDDSFLPLQTAASNGRSDAVRILLDNGANVNAGNFITGTPLIVAAGNGHTDVVRLLLERGADVCFKADGGTAEEFAQKRGYAQIVELLRATQYQKCK